MTYLLAFLVPVKAVARWLEVRSHRRALYSSALVVGPLLVGAGYLSPGVEGHVLEVLGFLATWGGTGVARKHTPKSAPVE